MPIRGFSATAVTQGLPSTISVGGFEELISATFTAEMDVLQVEPSTSNTALTVVSYYNPRISVSIEGIASGASVPATFTALSQSFRTTGSNLSKSVGDVQKLSVTGIYYPSVTTA